MALAMCNLFWGPHPASALSCLLPRAAGEQRRLATCTVTYSWPWEEASLANTSHLRHLLMQEGFWQDFCTSEGWLFNSCDSQLPASFWPRRSTAQCSLSKQHLIYSCARTRHLKVFTISRMPRDALQKPSSHIRHNPGPKLLFSLKSPTPQIAAAWLLPVQTPTYFLVTQAWV